MDYEDVCRQFTYNEDGTLTRRNSGKLVAGAPNGYGRPCVGVSGKMQYLHRVIFLLHHGYLPKYIDHIDGDKTNNRIKNLRGCTHSQNMRNANISKNNTSGLKGVDWKKQDKKWRSRVRVNGKQISLGLFNDKIEAAKAYDSAALEHHGEFAKTNKMLGLLP